MSFDAALHDPIILEIWPDGSTSFELYEDDGVTRAALPPQSAYARIPISVAAPDGYVAGTGKPGNVTISIGASVGSFTGQLTSRSWRLQVTPKCPLMTSDDLR